MSVAFELVDIVRREYPHLWDQQMEEDIIEMLRDAIECEYQFAQDVLQLGVAGLTSNDMHNYLKFVADERLERLGIDRVFGGRNNFYFMELQNLSGHSNFFERTVSSYRVNVPGQVSFNSDF